MNSALIRSISMEKYAPIVMREFPGASRIELRSAADAVLWSSSDDGSQPESPAAGTPWTIASGEVERRAGATGTTEFRHIISTPNNEVITFLVAIFDTDGATPLTAAVSKLEAIFSDICSVISGELALQLECNQLALELTERYEELNLVYSTDDQVQYFEEGQQALDQLVRNCADYLEVGLAALICRDRHLEFVTSSRGNRPVYTDSLLQLLHTSVYDRVESQVDAVVLNENDDLERQRYLPGRSENLIAQPIIDDHNRAIGILVVVAAKADRTFSTGDRNLVEVMAKKASRIIHAHHDSLTGLMNRSGYEAGLVNALNDCRTKNTEHCLLHINIDQLHVVNDVVGNQGGDTLICQIAEVLRDSVRDSDIIARLGGDSFGALLSHCSIGDGREIAEKVRRAAGEVSIIAGDRQFGATVSIGVATMTDKSDGIVGLMAAAEMACREAKDAGRNRVEVFAADNTKLVQRSEAVGWSVRVQEAVRDDRFTLYCQPVVPLLDQNVANHYEVLIRLFDDDGSVVSPGDFLPAAERYQLMPMVDRWVIRNVLKTLAATWGAIDEPKPVFCINLSGQSLTNSGFSNFIRDEIRDSGIPTKHICFEITETAAIANIEVAGKFIGELREYGCPFSLDDFGAGLSSFGYLKELEVDYLKIDGSFVRELATNDVSRSIVQAICVIAQTLGLHTVAEFVENDLIANMLRELRVDFGQGYGLGKPEPMGGLMTQLSASGERVSR